MKCNISNKINKTEGGVGMDDTEIKSSWSFQYLGCIIKDYGEFIEDVTNKVKACRVK